jgi:hypothetical protein
MRAQILILAAILALPILADSTQAVRPNQLQGITNSQVTGNDLFLLFDSSAGVTKKFPASELDIRYAGALTAITRLTGEVTTTGSGATAATVANSAVMGKLLTGFSASAGVVAATDTVLQAFDKIVGNIALLAAKNAPTFTGTVTLQDGAITVPTGTNLTLSVDAVVAPVYETTSGNGFFGNNGSNGCVGYVGAGCVWQWGTSDMGPMNGKRVLPYTDNASDLGGSSNRWKDFYLAGNATLSGLTASQPVVTDASKNLTSQSYSAFTSNLSVFGGDSGLGGAKGLVPATSPGDASKYLAGAGGWTAAGNLTSGTTGLTVTGGSGAVFGSGTSLTIQTATGSQPGLISAADWTTFNGKQSTVSFTTFGSTPSTNGGGISSGVITLQPADATHPGGVSTTTQTIAGDKTFTGTMRGGSGGTYVMSPQEYDAGNSSTAITVNWSNGTLQKVTMTGSCTFTFSNPVTGAVYVLKLAQDGTGSRTYTWPVTVKWPGGVAPTGSGASKTDLCSFVYDGTSYYGSCQLNY